MALTLWYYLRGYVIVEVSGRQISKFLNFMLYHNIEIWDVVKQGDKLYFKTYIPTFKNMRTYLRKSGCKAKISKKIGLPFLLNRYRKRKFFGFGVFVFIIILWTLSSYVWVVDVEGTVRIKEQDIIESLDIAGYKVGERKSKMDLREAEAHILQKYPDVVWTGIEYEGTRMVVHVAEAIPKPEIDKKDELPKTVVAKKDSLITYIATKKGQPLVKVGDVVKKGEILISGEMPIGAEDESLYYACAEGVVMGKTVYTVKDSLPLLAEKKQYLQKESEYGCLKFFGLELPVYNGKYIEGKFDLNTKFHQISIGKNFALPIGLKIETRTPYKTTYYKISADEAKSKLCSKLYEEIESKLGRDAKIINKEIMYKQDEKSVSATLEITVEEEIGYSLDVLKTNDITAKGE